MNLKHIDNLLNKLTNKKILFVICSLIILLKFLPYFILGERFPMIIHDNLDSSVAWIKILLSSGHLFSFKDYQIDQVMNGLPRSSLLGNNDICLFWFKLFGMYWGIVANKVVISVIGFIGMYLLLIKHFLPENKVILIPFGVATSFAVLPFWFDLSVGGLPLLLYAFLNIRKRNFHYSNWLIIGIFPFYSSLVNSGFFFIIVIVALGFYDILKTRQISYPLILGLVLLSLMYVLSNFRLFYSLIISPAYISHRKEFVFTATGFVDSIKNAVHIFINGEYQADSLHLFVLPAVLISFILIWEAGESFKRIKFILGFLFLTSLFYSFLFWKGMTPVLYYLWSLIPIQLQRFNWLHPMFWYILFGISLLVISSKLRIGKYLVLILIVAQLSFEFLHHELILNRNSPAFRAFFAERQFSDIRKYIGDSLNTYRVISVGMHPAVAQYNGFYTLDGYFSNYPLSYKHQFREIIRNELDKDGFIKAYFDTWGSRCYAFSSELKNNLMICKNNNTIKIERLSYNYDLFKSMGGQYILSAVEIKSDKNLVLKKVFTDDISCWDIFLYKVD
jgi:hypothetical protein